MKKNLGMFGRLPRWGGAILAAAVCMLCVSNAKATVLLDWTSGTLTTHATGVSGTLSAYTFSSTTHSGFNSDTVVITLDVASGYQVTGLTAGFTFTMNMTGLTIATTAANPNYSHAFTAGGSSGLLTLDTQTVNANGSSTVTFTMSGASGGSGTHTVTFTDLQFDGTVTPVPEPINYAMVVFGLVFVGGSAGHTLRRKLAAGKVA